MNVRSANIIVLCEDIDQGTFIRRFLMSRKCDRRDVHVLPLPGGKGSGEKYVRTLFPGELKAYRAKSNHLHNALIVAIDADMNAVADRVRELDEACKKEGVAPRKGEDRVMYVIPKRNIETWLSYLSGKDVNETERYPGYEFPRDCQKDVDRLDEMCNKGGVGEDPSAFLAGVLSRIRKIQRVNETQLTA